MSLMQEHFGVFIYLLLFVIRSLTHKTLNCKLLFCSFVGALLWDLIISMFRLSFTKMLPKSNNKNFTSCCQKSADNKLGTVRLKNIKTDFNSVSSEIIVRPRFAELNNHFALFNFLDFGDFKNTYSKHQSIINHCKLYSKEERHRLSLTLLKERITLGFHLKKKVLLVVCMFVYLFCERINVWIIQRIPYPFPTRTEV